MKWPPSRASPAKLDAALAPFGRSSPRRRGRRRPISRTPTSIRRAMIGSRRSAPLCGPLFAGPCRRGTAPPDQRRRHARPFSKAAAAAGLGRIVHVSSMLALFPPRGPVMTADDPVVAAAVDVRRDQGRVREDRAGNPGAGARHDRLSDGGPGTPRSDLFESVRRTWRTRCAIARRSSPKAAFPTPTCATSRRCSWPIFGGKLAGEPRHGALVLRRGTPTIALLLEQLTGHRIRAIQSAGLGDATARPRRRPVQRLGRDVPLTFEAAEVFTRSVPVDDRAARAALGRAPISAEVSFRDLIRWMVDAGHVSPDDAGRA